MSIVLVDGNHYGFWATASDTNSSAGGKPTGGIRMFLERMRQVRESFGPEIFVLWDGKSWRADGFTEYKANRKKNPQLVALKDQWKLQRPLVGQALQFLGIPQVIAWNYEADDLARFMVEKTKKKVFLLTADRDWAQLYKAGRVTWVDLKEGRRIGDDEMLQIITGSKSVWQFIQTKALCGDSGDNIPSVGNFGKKTADELFERFGDVQTAFNETLVSKSAFDACSGRLRSFLDSEEKRALYERNLKLVWLAHPKVPAPEGMRLISSPMDIPALTKFCAERALPQARNMNEWLKPFLG